MKTAVVCGAGGFIGSHLVKYLVNEGYWVRGVDIKLPEFSTSYANEFSLLDLRKEENCVKAILINGIVADEIYQLAADMGGMGFIHSAECEIMHNSALININMIHATAMCSANISSSIKKPKYFFSSSVCVYRDMMPGEPEMTEEQAIPANPDNEYGWEKLYSERVALAYGRKYGINVRIARFQNCYGPEGTWQGGREKAPAAICRKIAEVKTAGSIDIWGDGEAIRSYTYIDDMTDGIYKLMQSDIKTPTNIGCPQYVSVNELVDIVACVANRIIHINHIDGPVGVKSRNFSNTKIYSTGWTSRCSLESGICLTYPWIKKQVQSQQLEQLEH
jgi:nucleoside-diphosphate-sugar epimerase